MVPPFVICTVTVVDIAARRQLPSHVPPMNDIGRRRARGGADETFNGANAVAAARKEVMVSLSFNITPPMATAAVVIVIIPPSLVDPCHCCPCPPPPAQTPIPGRETCPRGATMTTTMAQSQSRTGHCCQCIEDNWHQSPPPHQPLSSISSAICATCQSRGGHRLMWSL